MGADNWQGRIPNIKKRVSKSLGICTIRRKRSIIVNDVSARLPLSLSGACIGSIPGEGWWFLFFDGGKQLPICSVWLSGVGLCPFGGGMAVARPVVKWVQQPGRWSGVAGCFKIAKCQRPIQLEW